MIAAIGYPFEMALAKTAMSGDTPYRRCAPPLFSRHPAVISSKTRTAPNRESNIANLLEKAAIGRMDPDWLHHDSGKLAAVFARDALQLFDAIIVKRQRCAAERIRYARRR